MVNRLVTALQVLAGLLFFALMSVVWLLSLPTYLLFGWHVLPTMEEVDDALTDDWWDKKEVAAAVRRTRQRRQPFVFLPWDDLVLFPLDALVRRRLAEAREGQGACPSCGDSHPWGEYRRGPGPRLRRRRKARRPVLGLLPSLEPLPQPT